MDNSILNSSEEEKEKNEPGIPEAEEPDTDIQDKEEPDGKGGWLRAFAEFPWMIYLGGAATGMLAVAAAFFLYLSATISEDPSQPVSLPAVRKIWQITKVFDDNYAGEYDSRKLTDAMYDGLVDGLEDPYADYYTAEEYDEIRRSQAGMMEGIGVTITQNEEGRLMVESVVADSPAEKAGVAASDLILAINGNDSREITPAQAAALIRGSETKTIELTLQRGDTELILSMEKGEIETTSSAGILLTVKRDGDLTENLIEAITQAEPAGDAAQENRNLADPGPEDAEKIGYIQISTFNALTPVQFENAYDSLAGMQMDALIIDLRDNLGGLVSSCVDTLNVFMPEGPLVYEQNRNGEEEHRDSTGTDPIGIPLVLLVNKNSASASEIFTGAVQDYGIGTVVGTITYGKGVEQNSYTLPDGSVIKLTTTYYYTPEHRDINGTGIVPDVETEYDTGAEVDSQLQKAVEILLEETA